MYYLARTDRSLSARTTDGEWRWAPRMRALDQQMPRVAMARNIIADVFEFIFQYSYVLGLAALYVAGTNQIDLLNSGLLMFFVAFFMFPTVANLLWIFGLIYVELVIVITYTWRMKWARAYDDVFVVKLLGLPRDVDRSTWVALTWHLVALILVYIQWELNKLYRRGITFKLANKTATTTTATTTTTTTTTAVGVASGTAVENSDDDDDIEQIDVLAKRRRSTGDGGKADDDSDEISGSGGGGGSAGATAATTANKPSIFRSVVNYITLMYHAAFSIASMVGLWFAYILITLVIVAFERPMNVLAIFVVALVFACVSVHYVTARPEKYVRWLWWVMVGYAGLRLLTQYIYQFDSIQVLVRQYWPIDRIKISLAEFGFIEYEPSTAQIGILPTLVVFVTAAAVLRLLYWKPPTTTTTATTTFLTHRFSQLPLNTYRLLQRAWIVHHVKTTALCLFVLAVLPRPTLHGSIYIVCVLPLHSDAMFAASAIIAYAYSMVWTVVRLLFLFPVFDDINRRYKGTFEWIGLRHEDTPLVAAFPQLAIIVVLLLNSVGRRWYRHYYHQHPHVKHRTDVPLLWLPPNYCAAEERAKRHDGGGGGGDDDSGSSSDDGGGGNDDGGGSSSGSVAVADNYALRWTLNNLFVRYGSLVLVASILVSVYVQANIIGLLYLFFLGVLVLYYDPEKMVARALMILFLLLQAVVLVAQYLIVMGIPTDVDTELPWENWSAEYKDWLALSFSSINSITGFFIVHVFASLLVSIPTAYRRRHCQPLSPPPNWIVEPRSWMNQLRYVVYDNSVLMILVLVFAAGTVKTDVLSFVYVGFALRFMLSPELLVRDVRPWRYCQVYVFAILVLKVFYQAPFIPKPTSSGFSWQDVIGLVQFSNSANESAAVLFDMAIFVLIAVQRELLQHDEVGEIEQMKAADEAAAFDKSIEVYRRRREQHLEAIMEVATRKKKIMRRLHALRRRRAARIALIDAANGATTTTTTITTTTTDPTLPLAAVAAAATPGGIDGSSSGGGSTAVHVDSDDKTKDDKDVEVDDVGIGSDGDDGGDGGDGGSNGDGDDGVASSGGGSTDGSESKKGKLKKLMQNAWLTTKNFIKLQSWKLFLFLNDVPENIPKDGGRHSWYTAAGLLLERYSQELCYFFFILNHIINASFLSMMLPLSIFSYAALIEHPRPARRFWMLLMYYVIGVIAVKFLFQLPVFCECILATTTIWSIQPWCTEWHESDEMSPIEPMAVTTTESDVCFTASQASTAAVAYSWPKLFGVHTMHTTFILGVVWEILALLVVLWHRHVSRRRGVWRISRSAILKGIQKSKEEHLKISTTTTTSTRTTSTTTATALVAGGGGSSGGGGSGGGGG
eukprot:CAMPEP_0198312490 /NCGR_PEP_ID=MMETSP1450-20131203/3839_1 /TAXON_ID=753684 ORGANISM="Madagascaria erythrocladiodes, Strain CCMP3234" /NCGR_SAMPLE_ID=MMETSP1450 /ASSEMBLY_ACC=CAM_ASM_001115 /LENGTH=1354 /DNA_ID=CAMNT_0044015437 /DNA_START=460 /DNA_END=4521 /DNA_ORIENTATION=+